MRAFIVCLFAALALAQNMGISGSISLTESMSGTVLNGTLVDLDDWFNGLWGAFNLTQTQAIACFTTEIQANTYFQMLGYLYQLTGDYAAGNRIATMADNTQYQYLALTINNSLMCLAECSDHMSLYEAAGFDSLDNQTLFEELQGIYFIAHILDWNNAFGNIFNWLAQGSYNQAGFSYGPILAQEAANSSQYLAYHSGLQAWDNQVFFFFNLTTPQQLPNCYNEKNAHDYFDFMWEWSAVVYNSTSDNVVNNTQAFFKADGADYLEKLQPVFYCEDFTQDQQRLDTALGVDPHSQAFLQAIEEFVITQTTVYMDIFIQIYGAFENTNVVMAASNWAEFMNVVAKTMTL